MEKKEGTQGEKKVDKIQYCPKVEVLEARIAPMSASGHHHRHHHHRHHDPPIPGNE